MSESMHVAEGMIHAWLDGALPPDESQRVEVHVRSCAACSAAVAEARGLIAASSRILSALDEIPGGVLPGQGAERDQLAALRQRNRQARGTWWRQRQFLAAASLVLVAGTSAVVWRTTQGSGEPRSADVMTLSDVAAESTADTRQAAPAMPPAGNRSEAARPTENIAEPRPEAPRPAVASAPERRTDADAASLSALSDAAAKAEVAEQQGTREARDVVTTQRRSVDTLAKAAQQFPLQQQAGIGQLSEAARQRALGQAGVANALGRSISPPATMPASSTRESMSVPLGCYELRGPEPLSGRLLGVPERVRLRADSVAADSSWFAAISLDSTIVGTQLRWQIVGMTTVELQVFRPLDSTVVRFRASPVGPSLQRTDVPAGVLAASATRIVCP
jgi:hypothetical protein